MAGIRFDCKAWCQNRAEEIAEKDYERDFYHLPPSFQWTIWDEAYFEYVDREAARIDAAFEAAREAVMVEPAFTVRTKVAP